jgi:hypothetical protein
MADLIDFEFHRLAKDTSAEIDAYAEPFRQELERLRSVDVLKLSGRELRKLRDKIVRTKVMLAVCDPETRRQIMEKRIGENRDPVKATFDELVAHLPNLTVRFV